MSRRRLILSICLVMVGAGSLFVYRAIVAPSKPEQALPSRELPQAAVDRPPPPSGAPPRFPGKAGETIAFRYETSGESRVDYRVLTGAFAAKGIDLHSPESEESYTLDYKGTFLLRFYEREHGGWKVGAFLRPVEHAIDGKQACVTEGMKQPFAFRFHEDGRIGDMQFVRGVPEEVRQAVEQIVRSFQVLLPDERKTRWMSTEVDTSGTYRASYTIEGGWDDPLYHIRKRKTGYVETEAQRWKAFGVLVDSRLEVEASDIRAGVRAGDCWISSIEIYEKIAAFQQGRRWAEVSSTFEGFRIDVFDASVFPADLAGFLDLLASTEYLISTYYAADPRVGSLDLLRELPLATAAYQSLADENFELAEATLISFLRLHPEKCIEMVDLLDAEEWLEENAALDRKLRLAFWRILAETGHKEAQSALMLAAENAAYTETSRLNALSAIFDVEYPDESVVRRLWDLHYSLAGLDSQFEREMSSASLYAIGALGHEDKLNDPLKRSVALDLAQTLGSAADERSVIMTLDAIGNHGGTDLIQSVRKCFDVPNERIRSAAFTAMRKMKGEETERTLINAYETEQSDSVRRSALAALNSWEPTEIMVDWACREVVAAKHPDHQLAFVDFLGAHLDEFPRNEDVLRDLLEQKPSLAVRHRIYKYITPERK